MLLRMDAKKRKSKQQEEYAQAFAKRLRDARGDIPQADLLQLLKENGQSVLQARMSHYENGRNYPDPPILAALAKALGVSADWLLGLTEIELPVADLEERLATATGQHKINRIMDRLSKERQQQLLDFANFLLSSEKDPTATDDLEAWRAASQVLERRFGALGVSDFLAEISVTHPDVAIALGTRAAKAIWLYMTKRPDAKPTDPLFATKTERFMQRDNLRHTLEIIGKNAGVEGVYPHRFRHTFAIEFLRNGGNIALLKALMGHESLEMVMRYAKIVEQDIGCAPNHSPADNWHL